MKPGKVLCFGELLLRLTPDAGGAWLQHNRLPVFVGGAELNVASALALWNIPSRYFTALPENGMSAPVIAHLESKGIDISQILYHGNRIGLYFLTQGQDLKHDALIYDRAHSAFAALQPGMIDWDAVLDGVSWFHFSAICPAISQQAAEVCREGLQAASAKGITTSVDLNYRAKLWQYGKAPKEIMPDLVQYCNVIMGNLWSVETMLNIPVLPDIHKVGQQHVYLEEAQRMSEELVRRYPKCQTAAYTFRFDAGQEISYYGALYTAQQLYSSKTYTATDITDKVGSGDCFMAGLIYGMYNGWQPQQTLDYATAAAYTKLFVSSDATNKTTQEIQQAINQHE